jgi:hypothetical protein
MNVDYWVPILVVVALQAVICTLTWRHAWCTGKRRQVAVGADREELLTVLRNVETGLQDNAAIVAAGHSGPDRHVYEIARRMAVAGVSAEKIAMACHIPAHEAGLLARLHAR